MQREARELGVELVAAAIHSEQEVPDGLRRLLEHRIDILLLTTDPTVLGKESFQDTVATTLEWNVPGMAYQQSIVKAGAFLSIQPSYCGSGEQAGRIANRLLRGARVEDLSVEPPDKQTLAINEKVRDRLGITPLRPSGR